MEIIKTVNDLIQALEQLPADFREKPVGVYHSTGEDGGMWIDSIQLQKRGDEESLLYYKGDSPVGNLSSLTELVTIVGSDYWV